MRIRPLLAGSISFLFPLSLSFSGSLLAQAPVADADRPTVIHATTTEVVVDLIVRDKNHHLVTDLQPDDVQLFEDGVPQKVKVFRNIQGEQQLQEEQSRAAKVASGSPDSAPSLNTLRQVNFVSVVFAQIAPLNLDFARRAVLEFLKSDNLPNTYVTIYRLDLNLNLVRAYTSDKASLEKAVNDATRGMYTKDGINMQAAIASGVLSSVEATTDIAADTSVTASPTGTSGTTTRESLVAGIVNSPLFARNAAAQDASVSLGNALITQAHFETGMRFLGSEVNGMDAMDSLHALVRSQEKLPGRKVVLYLADGIAFPVNRREVVDNLIGYANRSGVTFYTIDTRGLSTEDPMMKSLSDLERVGSDSLVSAISPAVSHHEDDDMQLTALGSDQGAMRELAEATGGFAVTNTNQIAEPMQHVMEDIRTHYELAYRPSSTVYDGHFRKIEVKVARPKVSIQTRKGYYAVPELNGEPLQPFELAALNAINAYPSPPVAFPYSASLIEFGPQSDGVQCEMAFEVPISGLRIISNPKTGKSSIRAAVVALIHNDKGQIVGKVSRDLTREVPTADASQLVKDRILYAEPVDLPRGQYVVDAAVTDELANKTTVTRTTVMVDPGDLGLSSLELVRRMDPISGPRNPYNPFELGAGRITPTLAESVASGKPLALYFVVYPAKTAADEPRITLHLYQGGKEVASKPFALPKAQADGSIPVLLQLTPEPGQYDIRVTAEQGQLVAQSTRALKVE
ncbi:MAG TPA: VWA domain-containing protein [Acidisarcina sp.]